MRRKRLRGSGGAVSSWLRESARRRGPAFYVLPWIGAGLGSVALFAALSPPGKIDVPGGILSVVLFFGLTALAEGTDLRLHHGKAEEGITLLEAAVAANILLFPPAWALAISMGGIALRHLVRRSGPLKFLFNLGQYGLAIVAALLIFQVFGAKPPRIALREILGIAMGMIAFGSLNAIAVSGIVALLENRGFRQVVLEGVRLSTVNVVGNTSVGILAAIIWTTRPELGALLLFPAFTLFLAYRGVVQGKELLAKVKAERDRLDRMMLGASDGIVLLDSEGRVEVWSPAMKLLTGIPAETAMGSPLSSILAARDVSGEAIDPLQPMGIATPDDRTWVVEMLIDHKEGGQKVALARHSALFDEYARCIGDVVIFHDITRQREVEAMKDDFLARVSHELRTPLTPIKGFAQSLLRSGDRVPPEKRRQALETVIERADHMGRIVEDLLLVSQISAGRASLADQVRLEPIDLHALCASTVSPFREAHPERIFELVVATEMPPALADPTRVEQIVANLLSNACKYSEEAQPIIVRLRREHDQVVVEVSDRGRGIAPDQIERIFEKFHRVENPLTMTTGGFGLGLFISRQFAEAMNGSLTGGSRLGEGSTFTLTLPDARTVPSTARVDSEGVGSFDETNKVEPTIKEVRTKRASR